VTAGASAPLRCAVIARPRTLGAESVRETSGVVERVVFPKPMRLASSGRPAKPRE
jgi:hypothetical protein